MDPEATLKELLSRLEGVRYMGGIPPSARYAREGDYYSARKLGELLGDDDIVDLCDALIGWVARGGFAPTGR